MRLAFAVAAHLDSEILMVDEVLAVGDAEFQKKCLGKMNDVAKNEGRTILFVSHNMISLRQLCGRGILLSEGKIVFSGDISAVIDKYENTVSGGVTIKNLKDNFSINKIVFKNNKGEVVDSYLYGDDMIVDIYYRNKGAVVKDLDISLGVDSSDTTLRVILLRNVFKGETTRIKDRGFVRFVISNCRLVPGKYWLTVYIENNGKIISWLRKVTTFSVVRNSKLFNDFPKEGEGIYLPEFNIESRKKI